MSLIRSEQASMAADPNPLIAKLGYPAEARLVIFHADDVGMCHGSNRAYIDLAGAGILKSGSVMAPCPWSPEIVKYAADRPDLDLGVHLTLNSEWDAYRWGPLSTRDPGSGLIDETGNFWRRPPMTQSQLNVEAALVELRAQIELMKHFGVDFTHIDNHMGVTLRPERFAHSFSHTF